MLKVPETTVVYRLRKAKEILEDMLKEVYYEWHKISFEQWP